MKKKSRYSREKTFLRCIYSLEREKGGKGRGRRRRSLEQTTYSRRSQEPETKPELKPAKRWPLNQLSRPGALQRNSSAFSCFICPPTCRGVATASPTASPGRRVCVGRVDTQHRRAQLTGTGPGHGGPAVTPELLPFHPEPGCPQSSRARCIRHKSCLYL